MSEFDRIETEERFRTCGGRWDCGFLHLVVRLSVKPMNDQRTSSDRRRRPTPLFSRYMLTGGRRRQVRRTTDPKAAYVDQLGTGISLLLILTFLFHCLDAGFTLTHLARGGRELNPVMGYLLRMGPGVFLGGKLTLAALGLWFLGVHKNFPMVRASIAFLFVLYAGVVGYHILLTWGS
jgi:hypothetical protein